MIYILVVIAFVIAETKIKNYIDKSRDLNEKQELLGGKITIQKHYNEGAFLSMLKDKKELVKTISCACLGLLLLLFVIMLPKKGRKLYKLGLSLVLGGAISNVADRVSRGKVVDYFTINVGKLKNVVFNLADMALFLGSALIFLSSLFKGKSSSDKASE